MRTLALRVLVYDLGMLRSHRARALAVSLATLCITSLAASAEPYSRENATVELHAHLFMKEGMTWAFNGDFFGPLQADSYTDRFSSQANPDTVNDSGIGVLVVSLYAHQLFTTDRRESIRRQMALAERFIKENPQWMIARTAGEARAAFAAGKRVMVLALEGASGILETPEDLDEFVGKRGLRIVTPLHLTDDRFGGVALLGGVKSLASPLAWIRSLFRTERDEGVKVNDKGLSPDGEWLTRELVKRKVWIDLAHASDHSQQQMLPIIKEARQPLLYTHMPVRTHQHSERAIADWMLAEVAATGGLVGLMPSEDMLGEIATGATCNDQVFNLVDQFNEVAHRIGAASTVFGSDFNGGVHHLAKPKCPTRSPIDESGFWNIGQTGGLWLALRNGRANLPPRLADSVDAFLTAWEKVNP